MTKKKRVPGKSRATILKKVRDLSEAELRQQIEHRKLNEDGDLHKFYEMEPYWINGKRAHGKSWQHYLRETDCKVVIAVGANRTGKSETGAMVVVSRSLGFDPFYDGTKAGIERTKTIGDDGLTSFEKPLRQFPVPQKWWACTEANLVDQLFQTILSFCPPAEIERVINSPGRQSVRFKNGSSIAMKSYAQSREQYQGAKLDGVWNDEEPPYHIYKEQRVRLLDKHGMMLFTLTPIEGSQWIHDDIMKGMKETDRNLVKGKFTFMGGGMKDNPYISTGAIEEFEDDFCDDEAELAVRVGGEYRLLRGSCPFNEDALHEMWQKCCEPKTWATFDMQGELIEVPQGEGFWKVWEESIPNMGYAIGVDPIPGSDSADMLDSNASAHVLKVATGEIVAHISGNSGSLGPVALSEEIFKAATHYNMALVCIEINAHGASVQEFMKNMGYPTSKFYRSNYYGGKVNSNTDAIGWKTRKETKEFLVNNMIIAVNGRKVTIKDKDTINEMSTFIRHNKHVPGYHGYGRSSRNKKDDRCMSVMLTWMGGMQAGVYDNPQRERMQTRHSRVVDRVMSSRSDDGYDNSSDFFV